jgi:hypothetical protein
VTWVSFLGPILNRSGLFLFARHLNYARGKTVVCGAIWLAEALAHFRAEEAPLSGLKREAALAIGEVEDCRRRAAGLNLDLIEPYMPERVRGVVVAQLLTPWRELAGASMEPQRRRCEGDLGAIILEDIVIPVRAEADSRRGVRCRGAANKLVDQPWRVMSIRIGQWASGS